MTGAEFSAVSALATKRWGARALVRFTWLARGGWVAAAGPLVSYGTGVAWGVSGFGTSAGEALSALRTALDVPHCPCRDCGEDTRRGEPCDACEAAGCTPTRARCDRAEAPREERAA